MMIADIAFSEKEVSHMTITRFIQRDFAEIGDM